ncbi:MAG: flagellar export protein FliJ [Candidatus Eisenbacteria bacterium]|uniref:Flagellar FliJ protein n=1 Tax=Eiseniibacteriota bacterium TaxID=2212470 RepID=A0A849SIK6_UNCEI|nr:flagellar export protein FliJ [Candidatus Eisenbacteria bacterium]
MKFRFPLDRLLRLRERLERERAASLGAARREEQLREHTAREAAVANERSRDQLGARPSHAVAAGSIQNMRLAVEAVAMAARNAQIDVDKAREHTAAQESQWNDARRDRRVIEKLRERRQGEHAVEASRDEQKELDAMAQNRRGPQRHAQDEEGSR